MTQKIAELEIEERENKATREKLLQLLERGKLILSPIRALPDDVLIEIFLGCLPTEHNPLLDPSSVPTVLTHVCMSWRKVAHACLFLWNRFHMVFDYVGSNDIARKWIERSGPHIPLYLSFTQMQDESFERTVPELQKFLAPISSRLHELVVFNTTGHNHVQSLLESFQSDLSLPNLNTLSVFPSYRTYNSRRWTEGECPSLSFNLLPNVSQLVIPRFNITAQNVYMPLKNLTQLFLSNPSTDWIGGNNSCFGILRSLPRLQTLSVEVFQYTSLPVSKGSVEKEDTISLPELTTLRISLYSQLTRLVYENRFLLKSITAAVSRVEFPNLKHLLYEVDFPQTKGDILLDAVLSKPNISLNTFQFKPRYPPAWTSMRKSFGYPCMKKLSMLGLLWFHSGERFLSLVSYKITLTATPPM